MQPSTMKWLVLTVATLLMAGAAVAKELPPQVMASIDRMFTSRSDGVPGCSVGILHEGDIITRAYGMADLERNVRNSAETIFEAGSVAKQFTAAAVLLLARDGKLSLDDPARKYLPELPDYGAPLTIRHMLNHTSGLRDWGAISAVSGWPRGSRVATQELVLGIAARQQALNFPSGTRWSYTNTGYNLAAIIVERVSGKSLAEFTRERIFLPLGMTRTSWRDDHRRVVHDRAIAYAYDSAMKEYHTAMPFENAHGNGGLLTTAGDLLKWAREMLAPRQFAADFFAEMQQPGKFNDGRPHNYALGLVVGRKQGAPELSHDGATGGYRAALQWFVAQKTAVALLCNGDNPPASARRVAVAILDEAIKAAPPHFPKYTLSTAEISRLAGMWRGMAAGEPLRIGVDGDRLHLARGSVLNSSMVARSPVRFLAARDEEIELVAADRLQITDQHGNVDLFERVPAATADVEVLAALTGTYVSDEADARYVVSLKDNQLMVRGMGGREWPLRPRHADAFASFSGDFVFRRDASGKVDGFSLMHDRLHDLRFRRIATREAASQSSR